MAFVLCHPMVLVIASCLSSRRSYTLPVPTSVLVGCTLVNGALATVSIYGIVAIVLGSVFGTTWPFLAPACTTATAYVVLQSLAWQVGRSRGLFMLLLVLFLMFAMPLGIEYVLPRLLESGDGIGWTGLTISTETIIVCCATWIPFYLLAVNGAARDRRGDAWSLDWLVRPDAAQRPGVEPLEDHDLTDHAGPYISFAVCRAVLVRVARQGTLCLAVRAGRRSWTVDVVDGRRSQRWRH